MLITGGAGRPWSVVTDVHGAPGISGWQQLVPGLTLRGAWEAVELARIPRAGISGLHRHTRTNEIYYALDGVGEYLLNGRVAPLRAGELAMTTVGSVHGLRNAGDGDLVWLVVEVPAGYRSRPIVPTAPEGVTVNPSIGPIDLDQVGRLDLTQYGLEPLRQAGVDRLTAGRSLELSTAGGEFFGYLVEGAAVVVAVSGAEFAIAAGTGVTLTSGERATLTATESGRLFWVRSGLPAGLAGQAGSR